MMNTSANSLHTRTYVLDGRGEEWGDSEDEIGICNACFIDSGKLNPTQIAMCECGEEEMLLPVVRNNQWAACSLENPCPGTFPADHWHPGGRHLQLR